MGLSEEAARHFASPLVEADHAAAQLVFGEHARALLEIAVEAGAKAAPAGDPALAELTELLEAPLPWRLAWGPRLGRLEHALYACAPAEIVWTHARAFTRAGAEAAASAGRLAGRGLALHSLATPAVLPTPSGWTLFPKPLAEISPTIAEACELIADLSPAFAPWVADAVSDLVLLDGAGGARFSATARETPGAVYLSAPLEPVEIAARLAHEASHQNFYALERLASLHDGSDTADYHSPIKQRGRPIDVILFSFHAFGNGALFQRQLAEIDPAREVIAGVPLQKNLADLAVMADHLEATRALTAAGEALWRPLAAELFGKVPA
ncbi:HEXXH motif-containing putative peptide modification protein [Phenylobacterium sp. LjRoot225]|uniref:aKG-HExxH-type peptide beta-hydroxylase n=1 Tax=Phenylobacterium sp. LjRoot225 TaxID=3342285 RepID=UPI003ED153C1